MRTFCAFICLFSITACFVSCQKQLHFDAVPAPPQVDSILLISTARIVNYDTSNVFQYQERQTFNYNKSLNQTVVNIVDSGLVIPGQLQQWVETFQYDAQNRLSKFTSTSSYNPATQIDFSYDGSGNISKAVIANQWLGKTIDCYFTMTTAGSEKSITMYDTSGIYNNNTDTRPEIKKFTFDANGQLIKQHRLYTFFKLPANVYEDTSDVQLLYDANGFGNKQMANFSFRFDPNSSVTDYGRDSILYTREGSNLEVKNSFRNLYKNMYWFVISEYADGFASALNLAPANFSGPPLKTNEFWRLVPSNSNVLDHLLGVSQNTFDNKGVLIKTTYPTRYRTYYIYKTEVFFTWSKLPK